MTAVLLAALILLVGVGHLAIWTRLHCYVHSVPIRQQLIDVAELAIYLLTATIPLLFVMWWWVDSAGLERSLPLSAADPQERSLLWTLWLGYFSLCLVALAAAVVLWIIYLRDQRRAASYFREERLEFHDFGPNSERFLADRSSQIAWNLPRNEILQLEVNRKELLLPNLPSALDGFTITHLSDLHLKGHMAAEFYREVVDRANDLQSEMTVISGDIFDRDKCLAWSSETMARLQALCGVYFVLGNHEIRLSDPQRARKVLVNDGLIDLGGRHLTLMIRDYPVVLAGNELPWHPPAADMATLDTNSYDEPPFKLLVAHTPDQLGWAQKYGFQLMLAGHNHGGQIRLPLVGAVVSPSRHGTRYSGGVFYAKPTLLHVSRGISGTSPLRFNCLPEITQLVLRAA